MEGAYPPAHRRLWPVVMVLSVLTALIAAPVSNAQETCTLTINVSGQGNVDYTGTDTLPKPDFGVDIAPDLSSVALENPEIRVVYGPFTDNHAQFAIRHFYLKKADNQDQVAESQYLDADAGRGKLTKATLVHDGATRKTVRLEWKDRSGEGRIVHEVTIFAEGPYVQIRYVDIEAGVNAVDLGVPGGTASGRHVAYGAQDWIRGYVTAEHQPTVGSYYNRYRGDGVNDPANAGALNYKGHFIVGVFNPQNGNGFGRVMPVRDVEIVKLLLSEEQRRGMEWFPYPFFREHAPFTGYLFGVTGGEGAILALGKQLADGVTTPDPETRCGETVEVTATAADGWRFDHWSGALAGEQNPARLTLEGSQTVTAHFVETAQAPEPTHNLFVPLVRGG